MPPIILSLIINSLQYCLLCRHGPPVMGWRAAENKNCKIVSYLISCIPLGQTRLFYRNRDPYLGYAGSDSFFPVFFADFLGFPSDFLPLPPLAGLPISSVAVSQAGEH